MKLSDKKEETVSRVIAKCINCGEIAQFSGTQQRDFTPMCEHCFNVMVVEKVEIKRRKKRKP